MKKYPCVLQHNEEDCGAACLASIAKYYGRTLAIGHLRQVTGTTDKGVNLLGLMQGAAAIGFNARPVQASSEILNSIDKIPLPAIIHWKGCHWVVLYGRRGDTFIVADPGVGVRSLSAKWLAEAWTDWVMLLLEPDSVRFYVQPDDRIGGFGQFLQRVSPYRSILTQTLLLNLVLGLLSLASPVLMQVLTDDVLLDRNIKLLTSVAIVVIIMQVFSSGLNLIQSTLIVHFAQRLELGLVLDFCRQILRLPLSYYEARRSGEVVSRLEDIQEINRLVSQVVISLPSQLFIALVSLSIMLFYSWKLTLTAIAVALIMTLSTVMFLPTLQRKTRNVLVIDAENQGILVETFKGALTLKTTAATPQLWEEFQFRFGRLAHLTFRTVQIGIVNQTFSALVSGIGSIALLWFGSTLVINEQLTTGQLLAFNGMNSNFTAFVGMTIGFIDELTRAKTTIERLTEVIDATPENQDNAPTAWVTIPERTDLICSNLTFHHAGRTELLKEFSLTIPGGQVTALIGCSGCGKSTLAKLLAGLYFPLAGTIRIGAYNLQDFSLDSLRKQVVLVPQEAHFWSRSIAENFRLASTSISFEQMVTACQVVGADEFISQLPNTYQTVLGEFGTSLSGGQRQRLAIARAIVHNPPILILDESTSALDPISEAQVLTKLLSYRRGKTTILISHRPKVIQRADWIVLLEQGTLKLQGSFAELCQQPGEHLDFLVPNTYVIA